MVDEQVIVFARYRACFEIVWGRQKQSCGCCCIHSAKCLDHGLGVPLEQKRHYHTCTRMSVGGHVGRIQLVTRRVTFDRPRQRLLQDGAMMYRAQTRLSCVFFVADICGWKQRACLKEILVVGMSFPLCSVVCFTNAHGSARKSHRC